MVTSSVGITTVTPTWQRGSATQGAPHVIFGGKWQGTFGTIWPGGLMRDPAGASGPSWGSSAMWPGSRA